MGYPATRMPAASSAAILPAAVPPLPLMMAPAWPIRRPGGAVRPAMKATIGTFGQVLGAIGGRGLLGAAADLAHEHDGVRVRVVLEQPQDVREAGARDGVAADAHAGRLADARIGEGLDHLVGQGARPAHQAHVTRLVDGARDDAHLGLAGDVAPGQLGPMSRAPLACTSATTLSMSSTGMCSVMQKMVPMPASTASRIASGAPGPGRR